MPAPRLCDWCRATVEFHGTDDMPPIRIVIADGEDNEDVVIKVRRHPATPVMPPLPTCISTHCPTHSLSCPDTCLPGCLLSQVSDEGGGIPRSHMSRIWSYLFTTADPAIQMVGHHNTPHIVACLPAHCCQHTADRMLPASSPCVSPQGFVDLNTGPGSDFDTASPLAGLGYGLPISRAYAR